MNKIVCFTGADRIGKATQAALLQRALGPSTSLFSFPDYRRWPGRILKAIYTNQQIGVNIGPGSAYVDIEQVKKDPRILQLLQTISRVESQDAIGAALAQGHVVCDRYDIDGILYGLVEGIPLTQLLLMQEMLTYRSDFIISLYGTTYDAPEEKDSNESDDILQWRVHVASQSLPSLFLEKAVAIDVLKYCHSTNKVISATAIHDVVCFYVRRLAGIPEAKSLDPETVGQIMREMDARRIVNCAQV